MENETLVPASSLTPPPAAKASATAFAVNIRFVSHSLLYYLSNDFSLRKAFPSLLYHPSCCKVLNQILESPPSPPAPQDRHRIERTMIEGALFSIDAMSALKRSKQKRRARRCLSLLASHSTSRIWVSRVGRASPIRR